MPYQTRNTVLWHKIYTISFKQYEPRQYALNFFFQNWKLLKIYIYWICIGYAVIRHGLSPLVKYFTDRSKAVLLLWIFYVFVLSCVCYVFVRVCLYVLCGHLLGKGWPLSSRLWCLLWVCHFPIDILGQVWYLIVSIPDLCTLTYFVHKFQNQS